MLKVLCAGFQVQIVLISKTSEPKSYVSFVFGIMLPVVVNAPRC